MSILESLFGKKDSKGHGGCCDMRIVEESTCDCGCGDACEPAADGDAVVVKVMGTRCKNCRQLHENTLEAAGRISKAIQVEYVTNIAEIAAAGVISTPALLIDGKVTSVGKVLSTEKIEELLQ